jgi:SAM-dependent methyltransferase
MAGYPGNPTLVYAIPFSGRPMPPKILFAFHSVQAPMNYNMVQLTTLGAPVDIARNSFAEKALEIGAKYIYFWDEDVEVPPQTLRELLYIMEHRPEVAVCGGIYCLKVDRPEPLVFKGVGKGPYWDWKVGEIFEVDAIGMGCTVVRVEALKDLEKPFFKTVDNMSAYLDNINFGEQWTEDLYFCDKLCKTGKWKILAHGQILPAHINLETGKSYTLPPDSKPCRQLFTSHKKIVDLGCGPNKLATEEGPVIGVDSRDLEGVDFRCDLRKLPFATAEMDIVYSSHVLEHFGRLEVSEVLDEWLRILKPKGEFRIVVPNIGWAAEQITKGIVDHNVLNVLYGQQEFTENFHRNGFTPTTLAELLKSKGLKKQQVSLSGYNILIKAWRK